jgi:hypothetical protein
MNDVTAPDTFNRLTEALTNNLFNPSGNPFFGLLRDLNLKLKAFDATSANDSVGLGVEYAFEKSLTDGVWRTNSASPIGVSLNLQAQGNVAFDRQKNPDDFLESGFKLHFFQSHGGFEPAADRAGWKKKMTELALAASEIEAPDEEVDKDPRWQAFAAGAREVIRNQLFYDVALNAALESNQSFTKKQWAYGAQVIGVFRAWDPALSKFNVFDYPFAALRSLFGAEEFRPSGQAIPSVLAGIDLIDPFHNDDRRAIDSDEDPFPRFRAEIGFKTKVARLQESDVWFSAGFRYFKELGASGPIRTADLDEHRYFAASLEFLGHFTLEYSTGKLPLDREGDQVFALGYKLTF